MWWFDSHEMQHHRALSQMKLGDSDYNPLVVELSKWIFFWTIWMTWRVGGGGPERDSDRTQRI